MANSEIRVGRISSINYESGMARVTYRDKDEAVTAEFPIMNGNDEYRMPKVGQDVLVAHLSNGSGRGAIIGTLWNKKYAPQETGEQLYRKDLSRKKNAAYVRYDDETGEYLIKVANLRLNGVNQTVLDGPEVEIAANISILVQTDQLRVDVPEVVVTSGEMEEAKILVGTNVAISQEENEFTAKVLKAAMEFVENLQVKAAMGISLVSDERVEVEAGTALALKGSDSVEVASGGSLRFKDDKYDVTLTEIMERLEAMGG